jgi:hypothetical protein
VFSNLRINVEGFGKSVRYQFEVFLKGSASKASDLN